MAINGLELTFKTGLGKNWLLVAVEFYPSLITRHHRLEKVSSATVDLAVIHPHLLNIRREVIPNRANDQIVFLIDQGGGIRRFALFLNAIPQPLEIGEIPLQLRFVAVETRRAHNDADIRRRVQLSNCLFELFAFFLVLNFARDAARTVRSRHQHQIATRQGNVGTQARALIAEFFFGDLDNDLLIAPENILNARAAIPIIRI